MDKGKPIRELFHQLNVREQQVVLAELFEITVNKLNFSPETFIARMHKHHPTLQQQGLSLMFKTIRYFAEHGYEDGRNANALEKCQMINTHMTENHPGAEHWAGVPFI